MAMAGMRRPAFRRSALAGGVAHRGCDVALECSRRGDRGLRQKAEDQRQHERQHHCVDGHAAAPSQKCEQASVHGAS